MRTECFAKLCMCVRGVQCNNACCCPRHSAHPLLDAKVPSLGQIRQKMQIL